MALEIPAYNLFMMCESLRREAFAPLPAGYSVRLCREDELETWMALNAESPESFPFLQDYYQRVYQNKGKLFFEKCLFGCDSQDTPVGTCFLWKAYGKITTLHWLKVLPQLEGLGLGRGLLSQVLAQAGPEDFPIYLHTHPSCFRAVHLYGEFGFRLRRWVAAPTIWKRASPTWSRPCPGNTSSSWSSRTRPRRCSKPPRDCRRSSKHCPWAFSFALLSVQALCVMMGQRPGLPQARTEGSEYP